MLVTCISSYLLLIHNAVQGRFAMRKFFEVNGIFNTIHNDRDALQGRKSLAKYIAKYVYVQVHSTVSTL